MTRSLRTCSLALAAGALLLIAADDGPPPPESGDGDDTSIALADDKQALAALQSFIGGWKGVGQPKRGSTAGAWTEQAEWVNSTPSTRLSPLWASVKWKAPALSAVCSNRTASSSEAQSSTARPSSMRGSPPPAPRERILFTAWTMPASVTAKVWPGIDAG